MNDEPLFRYRTSPDQMVCAKCGKAIDVTSYYIYEGKPYHRDCLPEPARDVATEVK